MPLEDYRQVLSRFEAFLLCWQKTRQHVGRQRCATLVQYVEVEGEGLGFLMVQQTRLTSCYFRSTEFVLDREVKAVAVSISAMGGRPANSFGAPVPRTTLNCFCWWFTSNGSFFLPLIWVVSCMLVCQAVWPWRPLLQGTLESLSFAPCTRVPSDLLFHSCGKYSSSCWR